MSTIKKGVVGLCMVAASLAVTPPVTASEGCSPTTGIWGKVATLYKKVTGSELIYCP